MIGRAALGRPWIVGDVAHYLSFGKLRAPPTRRLRREIAHEHLEALLSSMGASAGLRHARKHLAAYVDLSDCGSSEEHVALRHSLVTTAHADEAHELLDRLFLREREMEAA
jgi:tRNA-dihydrouridine synthase